MIEWIRHLFGAQGSGAAAKERLRLVLMTDHLALAPEMIEQMKRDFVDVISRYLEVDREKVEVKFEREDRALAMLANIPILSVTRPNGGNRESGSSVASEQPAGSVAVAEPPQEAPAPAPPEEQPQLVQPPQTSAPPRRKRRKRTTAQHRPAPAS
jgi:cell division topological specificity factor